MRRPQGDVLWVDGRPVAPLELAVSRRARSRGLLGRNGLDGALWLAPCRQVHTFRMRFPIDVAYVDGRGGVLAIRHLTPGRLGPLLLRARGVVEAGTGAFDAWGVGVGSVLSAGSGP